MCVFLFCGCISWLGCVYNIGAGLVIVGWLGEGWVMLFWVWFLFRVRLVWDFVGCGWVWCGMVFPFGAGEVYSSLGKVRCCILCLVWVLGLRFGFFPLCLSLECGLFFCLGSGIYVLSLVGFWFYQAWWVYISIFFGFFLHLDATAYSMIWYQPGIQFSCLWIAVGLLSDHNSMGWSYIPFDECLLVAVGTLSEAGTVAIALGCCLLLGALLLLFCMIYFCWWPMC